MPYIEIQYLPKWMRNLLIAIAIGIVAIVIFNTNAVGYIYVVLIILCNVLVCWLILRMRLVVSIHLNSIRISFFPFLRNKIIDKSDIRTIIVQRYKPLSYFGGWGLRWSRNLTSKSYTIAGNRALVITLKNGMKIYIGTQKPHKVKKIIAEWIK